MKSILIIAFSDLARDPRVHRQLLALQGHYSITTIGIAPPTVTVAKHINTSNPVSLVSRLIGAGLSACRLYKLHAYWQPQARKIRSAVSGHKFDVILANDIETLPLSLSIADRNTCVMLDAHEYAPREFENRWIWRFLHQKRLYNLCKRLLPKVTVMTTVSDGIADEFQQEFGIRPSVITNATAYQTLAPTEMVEGKIRMIHHGIASQSRHPEIMINLMRLLDARFSLDLMLIGTNQDYLASLKQLAGNDARIRFVSPVPMPEIAKSINHYDIGLFILPPVNLNYEYALPNKFFEFLQARLAIAIGPSSEMKRLVEKHHIGIVAKDFSAEAMADVLNKLTPAEIADFKHNSNTAAPLLCAEHNAAELLKLLGNT